MAQFRKRPVVIEAYQVVATSKFFHEMPAWLDLAFDDDKVRVVSSSNKYEDLTAVVIETLEGRMTASLGDWIIRGVAGEIYSCKPDIFAKTYEAVE